MSRTILLISITTLITIIAWTSFEVFRSINEVKVSEDLQNNTSQTSYTFDSDNKFLTSNFAKKQSIKYTRSQLNGQ